jgi:hypothetical protein
MKWKGGKCKNLLHKGLRITACLITLSRLIFEIWPISGVGTFQYVSMFDSHTYFIVRSEDVKNSPLSMYRTETVQRIFTLFCVISSYGARL